MTESFTQIKNAISALKEAIELMPKTAGVYKMIDVNEKVLYIGKAKILPKRVVSYTKFEQLPNRLQRMVSQIAKVETISTATEGEALLLEANLIKSVKPVYNISLRDDKSFPYIIIDMNHEFPRLGKHRGKLTANQLAFGPFASATAVNEMLSELQKIFQLRPCADSFFASRKRPCIQYEIKRCSGPCTDKISKEAYLKQLNLAIAFLKGKSTVVQDKLAKEMEALRRIALPIWALMTLTSLRSI
jgi:excinuclease ABC subunit C